MTLVTLLILLFNTGATEARMLSGVATYHLLLQDRIVLRRGEGGGVSFQSNPPRSSAYNHSSRPLFGSQTSYAAAQSRTRRPSRYTPSRPSLITSRDVSREVVRQQVLGPRWAW